MWQEALQPYVEARRVQVIGIVQEQHPARAALYRQWRGFDWPLYVDALNLLDHRSVPMVYGLDEAGGIVSRMRRPSEMEDFLARPAIEVPRTASGTHPGTGLALPHPLAGDALLHAGKLDEAIASYAAEPAADARARFRLGVATLRRSESPAGKPTDAQAATVAWGEALAADPGQYIWRRRLQQYGPTLTKPYNMYGWIAQARAEIRERGEEPLPLVAEPRGSEILGRGDEAGGEMEDFDPKAGLPRDGEGLVQLRTQVTPARVKPGTRARVRVELRVGDAWWNNETEPLRLFASTSEAWEIPAGRFHHPTPTDGPAESREVRVLEFEVAVPEDAKAGAREVTGYLAYNICEDEGGVCSLLRQDFTVTFTVDPTAPDLR